LSGYNFFADIRDQHDVAAIHTLLLGLGAAAGVGLMLSSFAYHFRESRVLDALLSLILIFDPVKAIVVRIIWNPLESIGIVTAAVFANLFLMTGAVLLIRFFFRQRISASQAFGVTFWAGAPLLLLIPFGMIAYRVMDSPMYVLPIGAFFVVMSLWALLRLLKGLSIIFDVRSARMYLVSVVLFLFVLVGVYFAYDAIQALPTYVRFLFHAATGSA